jgi:hypothetical protein
MKYLQTLVKIPVLGPDPPSFLLPGQLIEMELARQVKLAHVVDEEASISSLVEPAEVTTTSSLTSTSASSLHDQEFGNTRFQEGYDFSAPRSPAKDEK